VAEFFTKSSLSESRKWLVEIMQRLNFGRIEHLQVRSGEPVLDPALQIVRDIKIGGENGPRPESETPDFILKAQVLEFFEHLDRLGNGTVHEVEIKHGLPFKLTVEVPAE
jgi:hypothetical protein